MNKNIILTNEFSDFWVGPSPARIVSLVPSLTEIFYYFGLDENVAGITGFCEHPAIKLPVPTKIGGTKNPSLKRIATLDPDVIFASKEENNLSDIEALSLICPVIVIDIKTIHDNIIVLNHAGKLLGKNEIAHQVSQQLLIDFAEPTLSKLKTSVYLIWKEPIMTVGGDTFIDNMMMHAGFDNLYKESKRYPEITMTELIEDNPEYLLLSSEPYPFKQKHIDEFQKHLPRTKVILVDGQMFSWYGIRPIHAKAYFISLN